MKNNIYLLIAEIIVLLLVIISTFILCNNLSNNINNEVIFNNNIKIEVLNNNSNILYPMTDKYAYENLENTILNISNYNDNNVECKILIMIKKEENLVYDNLRVRVDDEVFNLSSKYNYEDDNYLYFDLTYKQIDKKNSVSFAMWLDEDTNDLSSNNIAYNFMIDKINFI